MALSSAAFTSAVGARVAASSPTPDKRFHYRYRAADLAWEAARLMPDNAPELAVLLCEAGGWLKARDPKAALARTKKEHVPLLYRHGDPGRLAGADRVVGDLGEITVADLEGLFSGG